MIPVPGRQYHVLKIAAIAFLQFVRQGDGEGPACMYLAAHDLVLPYPGDVVIMVGEMVVAQLVADPEPDEHGHRHTYGQAGNIDEGKSFILKKMTEG